MRFSILMLIVKDGGCSNFINDHTVSFFPRADEITVNLEFWNDREKIAVQLIENDTYSNQCDAEIIPIEILDYIPSTDKPRIVIGAETQLTESMFNYIVGHGYPYMSTEGDSFKKIIMYLLKELGCDLESV